MDRQKLAHDLRQAEEAYEAAVQGVDAARDRRNALVWRAIDEGWSYSEIATAAGLTRQRIGQIALTRPPE